MTFTKSLCHAYPKTACSCGCRIETDVHRRKENEHRCRNNSWNATIGEEDEYGRRYTLDFVISGPAGPGMVRSYWIVRLDEEFPPLTICYVR